MPRPRFNSNHYQNFLSRPFQWSWDEARTEQKAEQTPKATSHTGAMNTGRSQGPNAESDRHRQPKQGGAKGPNDTRSQKAQRQKQQTQPQQTEHKRPRPDKTEQKRPATAVTSPSTNKTMQADTVGPPSTMWEKEVRPIHFQGALEPPMHAPLGGMKHHRWVHKQTHGLCRSSGNSM